MGSGQSLKTRMTAKSKINRQSPTAKPRQQPKNKTIPPPKSARVTRKKPAKDRAGLQNLTQTTRPVAAEGGKQEQPPGLNFPTRGFPLPAKRTGIPVMDFGYASALWNASVSSYQDMVRAQVAVSRSILKVWEMFLPRPRKP